MIRVHLFIVAWVVVFGCPEVASAALPTGWPPLPEVDGDALIPAQECQYSPGPREVRVYVRYPEGRIAGVTAATGLMLSLHNWGGMAFRGAPQPDALTERFNLVVIGVDYLHSGPYEAGESPPYDFGYVQALDALRALFWVYAGLAAEGVAFDHRRVYVTGGSGGGNVSLMANKFAPRTFAGVFNFSGMARLTDDIAFGEPGGSRLNAGYDRNPASPRYLPQHAQVIRDPGHAGHAHVMKALGNTAKIIVVHGLEDAVCPPDDAQALVRNYEAAGLDIRAYFIGPDDVDGTLFKDAGHSLGDRTAMLIALAGTYLDPDGADCLRRDSPPDFERHDERIRFKTDDGTYVISFASGYPVVRFEAELLQ